jgi:hypothetical protein
VLAAGGSRRRIVRILSAAYSGGLLSDDTFAFRVDQALQSRVIDPGRLIGDLNLRRGRAEWPSRLRRWLAARLPWPSETDLPHSMLALDWSGAETELLVGRHHACNVVLADPSVSRRHARLVFRDERWILHDLRSTNGTAVNGALVGRCELRPGDLVALGNQCLRID